VSTFKDLKVSTAKRSEPLSPAESKMFPWGRVVAIHRVGDHVIIEYLERTCRHGTLTNWVGRNLQFHVNGQACSFPTLDAALVNAVAFKYDGINSQAGRLFCKAVGIYKS